MKVREDHFNALEIAGYLGAVIYYVLMSLDFEKYGMMGVIISFMLFMFVYVFTYPKFKADQVMPTFFGVVYVAVMLSFIYLTRNLPDGKFLVWLIFLCSWGCDTCAYCVGMLIGRHKSGTNPQPEEISRRWSRRRGRRCASGRNLCSSNWRKDCRVCADLCSRSTDLHGWRPGCFCY